MNTITPAMRKWCQRLANPAACLIERKWGMIFMSGYSSHAKPTCDLVDRMEQAGLICFESKSHGTYAHLTDAGRKAAGISAPAPNGAAAPHPTVTGEKEGGAS